jgi:acyl-CoA reductase-like NAD-dependent aldehyde dehydrogenase
LSAASARTATPTCWRPPCSESVGDDDFLSCEEVFGPVTSLYRFSDLDEALRRANAVAFGLSASIFTTNLGTAQRFVNELEAGILHVNSQTAGAEVHVPFGGIKSSGFGPHEQGRAAMEFYTESDTVLRDIWSVAGHRGSSAASAPGRSSPLPREGAAVVALDLGNRAPAACT